MSFNFMVKQRERADHEKSVEGRVTAVRMDEANRVINDGGIDSDSGEDHRLHGSGPDHKL